MRAESIEEAVEGSAPTFATEGRSGGTLRPFRPAFWFGGFNGLSWMIGLGTPMVLLAQHLGASALQIGLLSSAVFLLLPVQVVATVALPRLGFRFQMTSAWALRSLFLIIPFGLAWAPTPRPWMAWALVLSVYGFCLFRAFGAAAHMPWLAAILPLELRGRFFATDHAITSIVGVATLLVSAALFAVLPNDVAFRIVYLMALVGAAFSVWNLARLPSAPAPAAPPLTMMLSLARRLCLHAGLFRHYLLLMLLGAVVTSSFAAFTVYYLKVEAGLASSEILLFTAVQFGGSIVATWFIRHRIDVVPTRRFFQVALAVLGLVDVFWLALVCGMDALAPFLGLAYFAFGIGIGLTNVSHFTYLPELASAEDRPITMAIFGAVLGLLSGIAPMIWGLILESPGPEPGVEHASFVAFFVVGIVLSLLLVALYGRLPNRRFS